MMDHRSDPSVANLFELSFGRRPAEEFYDLRKDPAEQHNLAADPAAARARQRLAADLDSQLKAWQDPRALGAGDEFDRYPYYGSLEPAGFFDKGAGRKK